MSLTPNTRPEQSALKTLNILGGHGVLANVALLGVRGFYHSPNQYGTYDDALFLVFPGGQAAFNFNTDPVRHRAGHGMSEATKGMATLKPGVWQYRIGLHKGEYKALVQAGDVTVYRDADSSAQHVVHVDGYPMYEDTGDFGIHIHHGGDSTVSSIGCQTIPPEQWDEFMGHLTHELQLSGQKTIPYCLIEA